MLSYFLFSLKKRKTVIIVKNRNSPPGGLFERGGLFRKIDFTPGGLIEKGAIRNWGLIRSFTVFDNKLFKVIHVWAVWIVSLVWFSYLSTFYQLAQVENLPLKLLLPNIQCQRLLPQTQI